MSYIWDLDKIKNHLDYLYNTIINNEEIDDFKIIEYDGILESVYNVINYDKTGILFSDNLADTLKKYEKQNNVTKYILHESLINLSIKKHPIILQNIKEESFNLNDSINLINNYLKTRKRKSEIDNIINKNLLYFTFSDFKLLNSDAITIAMPSLDECLVYVKANGSLNDSINLAHELGHVLCFKKVNDLPSYVNMQNSLFSETISLLEEMLYLDKIKDKIDEETRLLYKSKVIYSFKKFYLKTLNKKEYVNNIYAYSSMLSLYLYRLYYQDANEFDKKIKIFNQLKDWASDLMILNVFDLTSEEIQKSYDFYLDMLKEEIPSKCKAIKFV